MNIHPKEKNMTKVLLVDHSGRGHAFADWFSRTSAGTTVYYAPGCSAITTERVHSLPELKLSDPAPMVRFCQDLAIDFVFVANASALAQGFVDAFRAGGLAVIGPDKAASRLEASKSYTKQLCTKYGIPIAEYEYFDDVQSAIQYVKEVGYQVVVKADGLCGGNGSYVCDTVDDAIAAINELMVERKYAESGDRVVIEKRLFGQELSFFALTDGQGYVTLPMAVDYPKSDDGNAGKTCGGVGSYSPHPLESPTLNQQIEEQLLEPILGLIQQEGLRFSGVIYLGCMMVDQQAYLLEINVRMGDPEAEAVLPRIETSLLALCKAILERRLDGETIELNDLYYCNVVATQGPTRQISKGKSKGWYRGWPYGRYGKHYPIKGIEKLNLDRCAIFIGEASVIPQKGLVTDGGRVLHVVGRGEDLTQAAENAYAGIKKIKFRGIKYRTDIGFIDPREVRNNP
jgi:phosphoribosylamine--glycine ligase